MSKSNKNDNHHNERNLQQLEQELIRYLERLGGEILRCDSCRHHCPLRVPGCFRGRTKAKELGIMVDEAAVEHFFGGHS